MMPMSYPQVQFSTEFGAYEGETAEIVLFDNRLD